MRSRQDNLVNGEILNAIEPDPEERDEDMLDEDQLAEDDTDDDEPDIDDDTDGSPTR
jgi:hypothetical protein